MEGKKEEVDEVATYSYPGTRPKMSRRTGEIGNKMKKNYIIYPFIGCSYQHTAGGRRNN